MNNDMIGGIIRAFAGPAIVYLVAKGVLPAGDYAGVITAIVSLATAAWSIKSNQTGKLIK